MSGAPEFLNPLKQGACTPSGTPLQTSAQFPRGGAASARSARGAMRPQYFIFSLPRSGSAWLSVLLTGPQSYCYHEPTADRSPAEWAAHARGRPESVVGAIDTAAYRYVGQVRAALREGPCYALLRDPLEIARSARRVGFDEFDAEAARAELDALDLEPIEYGRLQSLDYLAELWDRLIGTRFDEERARQLLEMRIERDVARFIANRPGLQAHAAQLLTGSYA